MFAAKKGAQSTSFNYSRATAYSPFENLIDSGSVRRLMDELSRSFEPKSVPEKFVGDVIITPDCMGSLMASISQSLGGYALMARTTPYLDRLGEPIAASCLTVQNRPGFDGFPDGADFDDYGVPTADHDVIRDGVLKDYLVDFYCSKKLDVAQTAGRRNLIVKPGVHSIDEIIAQTERGVLFSRFSGGSPNNKLDFSGVAKNSFYIEDGRIQYPLIETMISGNYQQLLLNIRGASKEAVNFGNAQYPYLAASGVTISGK